MNLIIGNIFGLLSSLLMVLIGLIKSKKKIIYVQSIQILVYAISNIFLGGFTGIIISIVNLFRNFLCYKIISQEGVKLSIASRREQETTLKGKLHSLNINYLVKNLSQEKNS